MCHLLFAPGGITPSREAMENAAGWNQDGYGWAIVAGTGIVMGKSMDAEESIDSFLAARKRHPEGACAWHARWATHGSVGIDNTHPFFVGGNHKTVLFHNGVLPREFQPLKGDDRSDTRVYAEDVLASVGWESAKLREHIGQTIGTGNKLVILSADARYPVATIINEKSGEWVNGVWHSNADYKSAYVPRQGKGMSAAWQDEYAECWLCGSSDTDTYRDICWACYACQTCLEDARHGCECVPSTGPAALSGQTFADAYGWSSQY